VIAQPIGILHSCFKEKFGTPRQSGLVKKARGVVRIDAQWEPQKALRGLEGFSHAWLIFAFHQNDHQGYRPVVRPPRLGRKGVGTFASRSPMRPNPIGLSLVKIDGIDKDCLYVSGVDIIDGTPVLDIKPYIHDYDSVSGSKRGWLDEVDTSLLAVRFSDAAQAMMVALGRQGLAETLEALLQNDIRNRNDKRSKNKDKILGFYFEDLNIRFRSDENCVEVLCIEFAQHKVEPTG
jgi:tRNA-Thr(GGU) m(6)t(6)A37 methyltransferase TsaA